MRVKCDLCDANVNTTTNNYVYSNGIHQHKKCPKKTTMSKEDKKDWDELRDAIKWACVKYDKPANWSLIGNQIRKYIEIGYSYSDQLYTMKYVVERDGTFWGYGRIEKFFTHALEHKRRQEEFEVKKDHEEQAKPIKQIKSRPSYLDM